MNRTERRPPGDLGLSAVDLDGLAARHDVVGAAVAVSVGGRRHVRHTGVTNIATGSAVRGETRFLVGSVCKAYVATAVMQLVDEGQLDLDVAAASVLPGELDAAITVRHLLTHTSGLPDVWTTQPDADEPDAIAALAASQIHTRLHAVPGSRFGYSNAGYVVLGRIIEVVTGRPFESELHERLLHWSGATFDLAVVATGSFAVGHHRGPDGTATVVDRVWARAAMAPAGGRMWASVDDLLAFGEAHAGRGGRLAPAVVAAMRQPQLAIPDHRHGARMGLGLVVDDRWGTVVALHDGGACGQSAYLRVLPDLDVVLALACTGGVPQRFHREVFAEIVSSIPGVAPPADVVAHDDRPVAVERYVGRYHSPALDLAVEPTLEATDPGALSLSFAAGGRFDLRSVDDDMFVAEIDGRPYSVVFGFDDAGRADRVLAGLRLLPRC